MTSVPEAQDADSDSDTDSETCEDPDSDGYGVGDGCLGEDCAPSDPDRHPGATELLAAYLGPMEVVETTDLPRHPDDLAHYDTAGQLALVRRFAESVNAGLTDRQWDFPSDFSSAQGDGFWRYGARAGGEVTWLTWSLLRKQWETADRGLVIGDGWVQPGAAQQAVISWRAPADGEIEVTASAWLSEAGGDGVKVLVARDAHTLEGPLGVTDAADAGFELALIVEQGQQLLLVIDCGPTGDAASDTTEWQISIHMSHIAGD